MKQEKFRKRSTLYCAFLLCGLFVVSCSDAPLADKSKTKPLSSELVNSDASVDQAIENQPLLSLSELLNAQDVKQSLAEAAAADDESALIFWQSQLLSAADEVNLRKKELALISGKQGLEFLRFQGMKSNYQHDFEIMFFEFGDVNAVYSKYPAFENMHAQSQALVDKRDALIFQVATQLQNDGFEGDATAEAKRQWQEMMKATSSTSYD